jgi:hypothetical protein
MENKKLIFLAAILAAAINVFAVGTLIYFAVDIFALYSENQFTGRMRSFDVDYWNAIGGSAVIIIPARLVTAFTRKMKRMEIDQLATDASDNISSIIEELERSFRNSNKWDPPKI